MSLLSREQIRIALAPQQVTVLQMTRGWSSSRMQKQHIYPCEPAQPGEANWQSAINALRTAVNEFKNLRADTVIVLSNHFVRYGLVPYNAKASNPAEETALVQHHFSTIYGAISAQWALRVSEDAHSDPRVASGIDQTLLDAIHALFTESKLRLVSIQPYLMAAFNQWRHRFDQSAWFALMEPGRMCLALLQDNNWQSLTSLKLGDDSFDDLAIFLQREKLLTGNGIHKDDIPLFVFAPGYTAPNPILTQLPTLQLIQPAAIRGCEAPVSAPSAMAMAG